jgi:predicted DCC family thiol-disulfide oxidoreductase YuxK
MDRGVLAVRRLLEEPASYLVQLWGAVRRGWNAFFFTPADPTSLGVIRVLVGLLLFWNLAVYGLDLHGFLGARGWADPEVVRVLRQERAPYAWSFWLWVPDGWLRPVWVVCMAVLALFTAGLFSRVTAVLAWVIVVSTVRRSPVTVFGFDQVVSMLALYLAVTGASGQAVSLDRFLARYRLARALTARRRGDGRWVVPPGVPTPTIAANLALRLIQLHLVLIYAMAGLAKLQGQAWWTGMAIWGTLASVEFSLLDLTWLARWPRVLNVLTHAALLIELSYGVLVWVRVLRPPLLAAVVLLHVAIAVCAPGLIEFGLAMIAANLAFVSPRWLRSLAAGRGPDQPAVRVLYDGACPFCRRSMALFASADPDHVVEPVDLTSVDVRTIHPSLTREACLRAMHAVRVDGHVAVGFDAMALVARQLPLFWLPGVLALVPGVAPLGRRYYQRVADARPRDVPCTDEVCALPTHRAAVRGTKLEGPADSVSSSAGESRRTKI